MKKDTLELAKTLKLARRLRPTLGPALGVVDEMTILAGLLERLWLATARSARNGAIGRHDDETIAELVGWCGEPANLIEALVETGWLDKNPTHRLVIHHWSDHCPGWVAAALKKDQAAGRGGWAVTPSEDVGHTASAQQSAHETRLELGLETEVVSEQKEPLPSPAQPNPVESPPSPAPPVEAEAWRGVIESLRKEGVRTADAIAASAREAGCSPAEVLAIVEHFRQHSEPTPPAWEAGALAERVRTARPNEDPGQGWYSPNPRHVAAVKAVAARDKRARDAAAHDERSQQTATQRKQLEASRPQLERLSPEELARLEAAALPDANVRRMTRRTPALREEALLKHLAEHGLPAAEPVTSSAVSDWEDLG